MKFITYIFAFIYLTPIALKIGNVSDKPIELALGDLALPVTLLIALWFGSINSRVGIWVLIYSYFPALAVTMIMLDGDSTRALSMINFSAMFLHIIVGSHIYNKRGINFIHHFPKYAGILVLLIIFSDFILGPFPRGCGYEGRWGGCFGPFDVYGFPNPPANMIAIFASLFIFSILSKTRTSQKMFFAFAFFAAAAIAVQSLSKSAVLSLVIVSLPYLLIAVPTRYFAVTFPVFALTLVFGLNAVIESSMFDGLRGRIEASLDSGDISTGRVYIWQLTTSLILDRPIFGYGFEYISNYGLLGTVHQQYLEVLYKSGIVGLLVYFSLPLYVVVNLIRVVFRQDEGRLKVSLILSITVAVLVACLSQPFITYAVVGNLVFFLSGYFLMYLNDNPVVKPRLKRNKKRLHQF